MKITNQRIPMVLPEVQAVCPSAFTTTVAPHLSQNYTHIPTSQVVMDMIELGWTPVSAQEVRSRKSIGFQKHIIRFQNQNMPAFIFTSRMLNSKKFVGIVLGSHAD